MKNRRILSLVLAFAMILGTFSFAFAEVPSDVVDTEFEDAVSRLSLLGVLEGYPDGTFKPENSITRAEFAAVAVRIKGMEAVAEASKGLPTGFTDVSTKHWASGYVGTAAKLGIVEGVGNNKFNPEAPVKYEEAITMIVRALGYEPAAKERGGYPFGYLIVANDIKLLEGAKGIQGLPATRGFVAQITDNALEIPMMIQVGYGPGAKWVVSGTEDTKVKTLLDEMGFAHVEGLVESVNVSKNTITVDGKTLKVEDKNFDYNYAEGMQVKAWYKGNALVTYAVTKEALVGVAKGAKGEIEVAGDDYDVARGATLVLNGKKVDAEDFKADYAKVALNADNEIVWAKGYTLKYMIVEEVDENDVFDYEGYDINVKGYVLLKDGRTIDAKDIEEEDVLAYNKDAKFAMVYNESQVGEIERVYKNEFRFEGEVYGIEGYYLDGDKFDLLNDGVLADMMAEEEVEVFFDTHGNVVLVKGYRGEEATSSYYGKVTHANIVTNGRYDEEVLALDVINPEGKKVLYDIPATEKDDKTYFAGLKESDITNNNKYIIIGKVVEITVNEDDEPTNIALVEAVKDNGGLKNVEEVKLSSTYVEGYRLQDSTIIFYGDKAVTVEDAEFTVVKNANIYYKDGRVVAIVGEAEDTDTEKVTGLVIRVRELRDGKVEFTFIDGERYTTEKAEEYTAKKFENEIVQLTVVKRSGDVRVAELVKELKNENEEPLGLFKANQKIDSRTASRIIVKKDGEDHTYELVSGAKIYEVIDGEAKEIRALDLEKGDTIDVYFDHEGNDRFVKYVVRTKLAPEDKDKDKDKDKVETVTYIVKKYVAGFGRFDVEDKYGKKEQLFIEDFKTFKIDGETVNKDVFEIILAEVEDKLQNIYVDVKDKEIDVKSEEAKDLLSKYEDFDSKLDNITAKLSTVDAEKEGEYQKVSIGWSKITDNDLLNEKASKVLKSLVVELLDGKGNVVAKSTLRLDKYKGTVKGATPAAFHYWGYERTADDHPISWDRSAYAGGFKEGANYDATKLGDGFTKATKVKVTIKTLNGAEKVIESNGN